MSDYDLFVSLFARSDKFHSFLSCIKCHDYERAVANHAPDGIYHYVVKLPHNTICVELARHVFKYRYVFLLPNEKQQLVEMVSQSPRLSKRLYTECKSYLTPQQQQLLLDAVLSDAVCSRQLYPQVTDQALRQQLLASVMRDTQESLLLFQDINDSQLRDTLFPVIAPTESLAALLTSNLERKHFDMLLNWVLSDWDQSFQLLVRHRHILNSEDLARVEEKVLSDRAKLLVIRLFLFITLDINTNLW